MNRSTYQSPFMDRYTGKETSKIFSPDHRYTTWRRLWIILAEAEKKCGLPITDDQILQMMDNMEKIPYSRVSEIESETHHDVVAHIRAFAEQCPDAAPIIHLGATSCYITDNTDVILMREAIDVLSYKLIALTELLERQAMLLKDVPTVGRTHFQPAQPITIGKRIVTWSQDFDMDFNNLVYQKSHMKILGCRGATGTADSFLKLFNGDERKVDKLEQYITNCIGIGNPFTISGQTYSRKQDYYVLQVLSGIAQSAYKFATDVRLLSGLGEVYEPFGNNQVGSSAMPYKKNPIMCEKICGLSRYVMFGVQNAALTASSQWLERTLDDSSNRRIVIPEMFIATEVILNTCKEVASGMVWNFDTTREHVDSHRNNSMVEGILTEGVKRGGNRQVLHEKLREYVMSGEDLVEAVSGDPDFGISKDELCGMRDAGSCGMSEIQVERYILGT